MRGSYFWHNVVIAVLLIACGAFVLTVEGCQPAYANGYGGGYTTQRSAYPAYDGWRYSTWHRNGSYFVRTRWVKHSPHTNWVGEDDGWLYTLQNGQYCKHSKIADYRDPVTKAVDTYHHAEKQYGDVVTGIENLRKEVAGISRDVAEFGSNYKTPDTLNLRDFLPDYKDMRDAELASDERKLTIIAEANSRNAAKRLEYDSAERMARLALAEKEAFARYSERQLAQFRDGWLSAGAGGDQATREVNKLDIDDVALELDVRTSCLPCHGGPKGVGGGVDFRDTGSIDWFDVSLVVATGEMPKGGQAWNNDQLERLKEYAKKHPAK